MKHWTETAEFTRHEYEWCPLYECFVGYFHDGKMYLVMFDAELYEEYKDKADAVYLDNIAKCKFTNANVKGIYRAPRDLPV